MPPSRQPTVVGEGPTHPEGEPAPSPTRPLRWGAWGDCAQSDPRALAPLFPCHHFQTDAERRFGAKK